MRKVTLRWRIRGSKMKYTDKELLDVLTQEVREEALMLWDGNGLFPGGSRGLSLRSGNLRLAIAGAFKGQLERGRRRGAKSKLASSKRPAPPKPTAQRPGQPAAIGRHPTNLTDKGEPNAH